MEINILVNLSYEKKYSELNKKLEMYEQYFPGKQQALLQIFQNLNLADNSLIFLYFLDSFKSIETVFQLVGEFLIVFDPEQIKFNYEKLYELGYKYLKFAIQNKIGGKLIRLFEHVIMRLGQGSSNIFTPFHSYYTQLCLRTKFYKESLKIIETPITKLDKNKKFGEEDLFSYYYYSGMLFIGLKKYSQAIDSFVMGLNMFQKDLYSALIETRKKLILLLIRQDKSYEKILINLYSKLNTIREKLIEMKTQQYLDLLEPQNLEKPSAFDSIVAKHQATFKSDSNLGLVYQAKYGVYIKILKKFSKIYTIMPVKEFVESLSLTNSQLQNLDILNLIYKLNDVKWLVKLNTKMNSLEFIDKNEIDYEKKVILPLKLNFKLLKQVTSEYGEEHEIIVQERLANPDTMYT